MYSNDNSSEFNKDNIDEYLKALAKEYRRLNGKSIPAEIILVGGASVIANYNFRGMTTDIDAIIRASSAMKEAINNVGDKYHLSNGWLNTDFTRTVSYSAKLYEHSKWYRQYSNVLNVRTISAEYLIAMKLCSGRRYKKDMSDIVGILLEHQKRGLEISMADIDKAIISLYGSWDKVSTYSRNFIEYVFSDGDFQKIYDEISAEEINAKEALVQFEKTYPKVLSESNMDSILDNLSLKETAKEPCQQKESDYDDYEEER